MRCGVWYFLTLVLSGCFSFILFQGPSVSSRPYFLWVRLGMRVSRGGISGCFNFTNDLYEFYEERFGMIMTGGGLILFWILEFFLFFLFWCIIHLFGS